MPLTPNQNVIVGVEFSWMCSYEYGVEQTVGKTS